MVSSMISTWTETTLGEVIDIFDHKRVPLSSLERSKRQGQYPYYGASGIIDYIDDYIFDGRYLLVAEDGENLKSRNTPIAFFASGRFWVNNHAHIIRAKTGRADDYLLMSALQSSEILPYITGTAQPKLSQANLKIIRLRLPPLRVQRKIAAILSAYDDLIENGTRRIKILEEMAQAIYRGWFVNFRFPGHEKVKMVDSESGMIPEGWRVVSYTDIIDVLSGGTPRTSAPEYWYGDMAWFTPRDMRDSWYVLKTARQITKLGLSKCNSDLYPPDTVFITARGTVGRCVLAGIPMAMSQTSYALRGHQGIPQSFVFFLTLSLVERFRKQATGAVFDTIVVDTFRKQRVVAPSLATLDSFAELVGPFLTCIKNLQLRDANLRQTRDLLLPKLISGEVDVSELDIKMEAAEA